MRNNLNIFVSSVLLSCLSHVMLNAKGECVQPLDSRQIPVSAVVNTVFQPQINPATIRLHEQGQKILFSEGSVSVSINSNTQFTVNFKTANPDGNINNGSSSLKTFYIILPAGSPQPSVNDPRWMSGDRLNSYTETSNNNIYERSIYVRATKDNSPYGFKDYTDMVTITANDRNGSASIMKFQVLYRIS